MFVPADWLIRLMWAWNRGPCPSRSWLLKGVSGDFQKWPFFVPFLSPKLKYLLGTVSTPLLYNRWISLKKQYFWKYRIFDRSVVWLNLFRKRKLTNKNPTWKELLICFRLVLISCLYDIRSRNHSNFKFLTLSALFYHWWAQYQLILNHYILWASGDTTNLSD